MYSHLDKTRDLLKASIEATDGYLGAEKNALRNGVNTQNLKEFMYFFTRAQQSLSQMGVLDRHLEYMYSHIQTMERLAAKNPAIQDLSSQLGGSFQRDSKPDQDHEYVGEKVDFNDDDLENLANTLTWEDIVDFYTDEELDDESNLAEALTPQARIKKRQTFARFKGKRGVAKNLKLRRTSDLNTLQRRSKLAARRALYNRFLRGRNKSDLSAAEKDRIEKQVASLKTIQSTLAQKMLPKIRGIEQRRLASYRSGKAK